MSSGVVNLLMTVIGFVVSSLFIVFILTRLVWARIHLTASRRRSFHVSSDLNTLERGSHGLEPLVLANFQTKKYGDAYFREANDYPQCTICLGDFHEEDTLRLLPFCGHSFHVTCIDIWMYQHSTCPICRMSMQDNFEKRRLMRPMFSSAIREHYATESIDTHSHHWFTNQGDMTPARVLHLTFGETGEPTTTSPDETEPSKNSITTSVH